MTTISGLFVSLDLNDSLNLQASKTAKDSRQTYSQKPYLTRMSQQLYLAHAGGVILEGARCCQWGKTMKQTALWAVTAKSGRNKALDLTRLRSKYLPVHFASSMSCILNVSLNYSRTHLPHPWKQIIGEQFITMMAICKCASFWK